MRIVMVGLIAVAAVACGNPFESRACTLIGCTDGLSVFATNSRSDSVTIVVRSATGEVLATIGCRPNAPCGTQLQNQTPATVTVTTQTSQGSSTVTFTPQYIINQPNGPECGPTCRQATINLSTN